MNTSLRQGTLNYDTDYKNGTHDQSTFVFPPFVLMDDAGRAGKFLLPLVESVTVNITHGTAPTEYMMVLGEQTTAKDSPCQCHKTTPYVKGFMLTEDFEKLVKLRHKAKVEEKSLSEEEIGFLSNEDYLLSNDINYLVNAEIMMGVSYSLIDLNRKQGMESHEKVTGKATSSRA